MNKVVFTQDRVVMAVVDPSGYGEMEIISKLLIGNTFYPKISHIKLLNPEMQ